MTPSTVAEHLRALQIILRRAPTRMTPDGAAVKALIPTKFFAPLELAADLIEEGLIDDGSDDD